jgi:hypothetical protein
MGCHGVVVVSLESSMTFVYGPVDVDNGSCWFVVCCEWAVVSSLVNLVSVRVHVAVRACENHVCGARANAGLHWAVRFA